MLLTRYEPYGLVDQFNNEVNRLFAGNRSGRKTAVERDWAPAVDICEEDDRFVLTADIPGVAREAVDITLDDGVLTIKGERSTTRTEEAEGYRRRERMHGIFVRQFTVPETVNAGHISATVNDGVLEVVIPKQEKPQPKKISVN